MFSEDNKCEQPVLSEDSCPSACVHWRHSCALMKCKCCPSLLVDEAELEAVLKKMDGDRAEHDQKLERQAQLLDTRAAKIRKLEGIYSSSSCSPSSLLLPETRSVLSQVCTVNLKLQLVGLA